MSVVVMCGVTA